MRLITLPRRSMGAICTSGSRVVFRLHRGGEAVGGEVSFVPFVFFLRFKRARVSTPLRRAPPPARLRLQIGSPQCTPPPRSPRRPGNGSIRSQKSNLKMKETSATHIQTSRLVLLVLGDEIDEVALGLCELHLIHALARVPVQEGLPPEHERELVVGALEEILDARRVGNEGGRHAHPRRRHVTQGRRDAVWHPLDEALRLLWKRNEMSLSAAYAPIDKDDPPCSGSSTSPAPRPSTRACHERWRRQ